MHNLWDFLMNNNLFMSNRPDVIDGVMVITFRKTKSNGELFNKSYRLGKVEISRLNIDLTDVLIDFAERFMKEFEAEELKGE